MKLKITKDGRTYQYEGTAEEINKQLEKHGLKEKPKKKKYKAIEEEKPEEDGEA